MEVLSMKIRTVAVVAIFLFCYFSLFVEPVTNFHKLYNTILLFVIFYICWRYEKYHMPCLCINNTTEITLSISNIRLSIKIFVYSMVIAIKKCSLPLLFEQHKIIVYLVIPISGKLHIRKLPLLMVDDKQGCRCSYEQPDIVYRPSVTAGHQNSCQKWLSIQCPERRLSPLSLSLCPDLTSEHRKEIPMNNLQSNNKQLVVGIDPHEDILGIIYLDSNNTILKGFSVPNCSLVHFEQLTVDVLSVSKSISAEPVFVIESTNVFWRPLFSFLHHKGFGKIYTVNSYQTNSSRKTRMRKTKTDLIDAKNIAELYLQGKAHFTRFPPGQLFDLREFTRFYSWISDIKGRLLNRIYAYLFQVFPEYMSVFPKKYFSKTLALLLKKKLFHPSTMANMNPDKLLDLVRRISRDKYTIKVKQLVSLASNSTGITEGKYAFSNILSTLVKIYQFLDAVNNLFESRHIKPIMDTVPNKFYSLKGFSTISQASFVSELGDPNWFTNADDALAFFGLDPALGQSGRRLGQGKHISKAGTKFGRETMFLAASPCIMHNPVIKQKFKKLRSQGRHYIDAKTIIAADLTKICYAMFRDNSEFNPNKLF